VDDCFVLAANYVTSYNYSPGNLTPPVLNHTFMLQIGLRTLATTSSSSGSGVVQ
jgi:LPS-assembly protein